MSRALATFGTGAALMVWLAAPVEAAHEVDHRSVVIVHLHDDVLEPLRVAVGRATLSIEARFNPVDPRTPRGTRVDFLDSAGRERRDEFLATLERYLEQ